jgi:hypothetical protein
MRHYQTWPGSPCFTEAATLVSGSIGDYDDASRHDIGLTCQILDDPTDLCEPCLIAKIRRSSMEAVGHGHGKSVS